MLDITFGVLNFNPNNNLVAQEALSNCLYTLKDNKNPSFSSEVYVIDQGSVKNKQQEHILDETYDFGWRSIFLDKNVGISRGINLLARMARGQYICLVTSDTEFSPGLDTLLVEILEKNPHVWQICPASDNSELEHQRKGFQAGGLAYTLAAQELTIQMWPRKTFDTIGYFDERWKACFENSDYALRIFLAGGNIAVTHDGFCHHKHGMCIKSGARNETYKDYIYMPDGFNQEVLYHIWNKKWPSFSVGSALWHALYSEPKEEWRSILHDTFKDNIYLPYIQNVGY